MDTDRDSEAESLDLAALDKIDRACQEFEKAWKQGKPRPVEAFLVGFEGSMRSALLRELLLLEIDYRSRRVEQPLESDYTSRFPEDCAVVAAVFSELSANGDVVSAAVTAASSDLSPKETPASGRALPQKVGKYVIIKELGCGGFGTVYLARDEQLRREVAIKIPRRERFKTRRELQRFLKEARTTVQLKHPGIVPIHEAGELADGSPFVVMAFLDGESLETTLRTRQLSYDQIATLMVKIANVVHYAHRRGVVHRDLKPSNIIIDAEGNPCITDFGLAERWDSEDVEPATSHPTLAGTLRFIPPEVYEGSAKTDPAIDVYALGIILYLALTGTYPFDGNTFSEVMDQVVTGAPSLPQEIDPDIPEKLQRICLKAIEPHTARYRTAEMFASELKRFLAGREVLARPMRYDAERRGRLQNHYAEIHAWRNENLITVSEMDRLARPYWFLLRTDSPWPSLARRFPLEAIAIRLGVWLLLLSTLLWPTKWYWGELPTAAQRLAAVAPPIVAVNGVGWIFWYLGSRWNARVFLGTGALLLPLLVVVLMDVTEMLTFTQAVEWELFPTSGGGLQATNLRFTVAMAAFVAYCVFLMRRFPGKLFAIWLAVGIVAFYTGCLALCGLKEWLLSDPEHVARTLVCYLFPCLLLMVGSLLSDHWGHRSEAAMLYVFFPIPLAALLTLLAYYGSVEWLKVERRDFFAQTLNLWWMANGVLYAVAAVLSHRASAGYIRFWSTFFVVLIPVSVLLPCNLLVTAEQCPGPEIALGGEPLTVYELLAGLATITFIVMGTVHSSPSLTIPGLLGLAVFVFRFTERHFQSNLYWPLAIALIGGIAMLAGVASAACRARTRDGQGAQGTGPPRAVYRLRARY